MNPRRTSLRRAFTLMEMVTSCVILSMLMLSLGYGLKLALVSTGNGASQAMSSLEASDLVERVTDDLNEAINFTEKTSQAVTFTVPDRNADGQPDKIRYAWWPSGGTLTIPAAGSSGSSGSAGLGGLLGGLVGGLLGSGTTTNGSTTLTVPPYTLTRELNGALPSVMARDVRAFSLDYLYRTMAPAALASVGDRLLWQHDPIIGLSKDFALDINKWMGETFVPQLPANTTSWSISRIFLYMKADATYDGLIRVSLRTTLAASNTPTPTILDSALISEVSLNDSYSWVEIPFTNLNNLSPTTKYTLLVEGRAGVGPSWGTLNWMQVSLPSSSTWLIQTTSGGGTWPGTSNLNSMRYKIYGTTVP